MTPNIPVPLQQMKRNSSFQSDSPHPKMCNGELKLLLNARGFSLTVSEKNSILITCHHMEVHLSYLSLFTNLVK